MAEDEGKGRLDKLQMFEGREIRSVWVEEEEDWYFSVVDVVGVLSESKNPQTYWRVLKKRLVDEGNQTVTNCNGLKMRAADGKMRVTDAANTEQVLRLVQSIPSPKAEPFKLWLAEVGRERIDEVFDPELAIERAVSYYRRKGYSEEWISQRLFSIRTRRSLTFEWRERGVKTNAEYAILTNDIYRAWSDMTAGEYKGFKGLTKESLRDNMSDMELALSTLAEATTAEIERAVDPDTFDEHRIVAESGGEVAGVARAAAEKKIGHAVVTPKTAPDFGRLLVEVVQVEAVAEGDAD
ncbi:phage antirepressor protein [Gordonibacter sp. 28C]|uniref:BRO-N domain-containing protein n=1 Tax=Gordonibacter sp. 28C TaxID=2078569 RepID=UPI000DF78124|nr:Bro-N domain-containing protein [Gordonibacter sp. 28C]RDB61764.1 phage antirepressor protein [Gordonibacter sp. 28C]